MTFSTEVVIPDTVSPYAYSDESITEPSEKNKKEERKNAHENCALCYGGRSGMTPHRMIPVPLVQYSQ